jgi:hypothetical protein
LKASAENGTAALAHADDSDPTLASAVTSIVPLKALRESAM